VDSKVTDPKKEYNIEIDISNDPASTEYFFYINGLMTTKGKINQIEYDLILKANNNIYGETSTTFGRHKVLSKPFGVSGSRLFLRVFNSKLSQNNDKKFGVVQIYSRPYSPISIWNKERDTKKEYPAQKGNISEKLKNQGGLFSENAQIIGSNTMISEEIKKLDYITKIDLFVAFIVPNLPIIDYIKKGTNLYINNIIKDANAHISDAKTKTAAFIDSFRINPSTYYDGNIKSGNKYDGLKEIHWPFAKRIMFKDFKLGDCQLNGTIRSKYHKDRNPKSEICCLNSKTYYDNCPFWESDVNYIDNSVNRSFFTVNTQQIKNELDSKFPVLSKYSDIYKLKGANGVLLIQIPTSFF